MPYFQKATRSRKLSRTFFTTHEPTHPTLNERDFFDFPATREAAGKRTNISVRFLYYFFNGLRLSKNASERDIAPFTPQRYNIPPTLSKHFPTLFPSFFPPRQHPYCAHQQPYSIPRHPYSVSQHNKNIFHKRKGVGVIFLKLFLCHFQRRKATSPYICKKKGLLELSAENT